MCDENGDVAFRNARAVALMNNRHGDALAAQAVTELLDNAWQDGSAERTLDLYGPPRQTLTVRTRLIDDGRRPLGVIAIIEDVSERRRLEEIRRDFVANVSHELKTPIGALGLLAETLTVEPDPVVAQRLASRINTEAFRVSRIIDDLLDLSRIESEEAPPREPIYVNLVMAEAVERVKAAADQRRITIELDEPDPPVHVLGDRRQLVSAMHSLLENAVTFSYEDSIVRVAGSQSGNEIHLAVIDLGVGIPPAISNASSSVSTGWTTVGVVSRAGPDSGCPSSAMSPAITRAMSRSTPGKARDRPSPSFCPVLRSTRHEQEDGRTRNSQTKVLLAEDDESFIDALVIGLSREGFDVTVARDGNEALRLFAADEPDLVLLDLMLPRLSGIDVCRSIRLGRRCRSSWSPPREPRSIPWSASKWAPTITWPSPTGSESWSPGCALCFAGRHLPMEQRRVTLRTHRPKAVEAAGCRRGARSRWYSDRPRPSPGLRAEQRGPSQAQGVRAALPADGERRSAAHPRCAHRSNLGLRLLRRHQNARRAHQATQNPRRGGPVLAQADHHHPGGRLPVRRRPDGAN